MSTPLPPETTAPSDIVVQSDTVMDDFVFGGIEADDSRLLTDLRQRATGIRHRHALHPRNPRPHEAVEMTVYVGPDLVVDRVTAYVTADGSPPSGTRGVATQGFAVELTHVDTEWHQALWDYVEVWRGTVPGEPDQTLVQYIIEGWRSNDPTVTHWSSEPNLDGTVDERTRYGYGVDTFHPPTWARDAVVYQIFIDRFSGTIDLWLTRPELNQFTGGTIQGVQTKLDYLADLGISVIWLSPIFTAVSYHAYDTVDYYTIDPRFGTKADLQALVAAAHARGIRVILDFVANHTGITFAPFVAAQQGNPTYRNWFTFGEGYPHGYRSFFGVATMPQLNTDNPAVSRYLCDAARYWLTAFDVDGFRLDYAAGPSHAFWSEFQAACKDAKPDCWLFGEATLAGYDLRSYLGRLDGCLDFSFCRLIRQLCLTPRPTINLSTFLNHLRHGRHFFGDAFLLPAFIDNHDMNRFLWMAGNDKTQLRLALGLLFALGGPPILYYGTEVGLSQPRGKGPWREEARHPMRWEPEQQDQALLAYCQLWIAQRRHHPALTAGTLTIVQLDERRNVGLVERSYAADQVLIAINLGDEAQPIALPPGPYQCADQVVHNRVELAGHSVVLLTPPQS
ncbi:MAG: hypothetical protein KDE19_20485 [Caldilineaceae bacterium]|nr:hypothetical protein [Caldilineaceae bacterium]